MLNIFSIKNRILILFLLLTLSNFLISNEKPKIIILGFDGADFQLASQFLKEGKLPNLAKLEREGVFKNMIPTNHPRPLFHGLPL